MGHERSATRRYVELVGAIHRRGITTLAAAFPLVLSDGRATGGWQQLLGTPVDGPPFSQVTVMVYSSVVEGYARGLLDRADTVSLLAAAASAAVRRYGVRASLSLGATGPGRVRSTSAGSGGCPVSWFTKGIVVLGVAHTNRHRAVGLLSYSRP